jgi:hypothetical protein
MAGAPKGNTNGAKDKRLITDELRRVVTQGPEKLKKACKALLENAANGDIASFNVIADRLDGKPAQSLTVGGDNENPLLIEPSAKDVIREFLKSQS